MTSEEKKARITQLTELLSKAARAYEQEDREIISNFEYDRLYDELKALEDETGFVLADSPTHKVGFEVLSALPKERHASPMLSLNKTKVREELSEWLNGHKGILSWKMDGLTIVLTYRDGQLFKAVTRGNGEIGEVITSNALAFKNVPRTIDFKGELVIRGEAVIRYSDFERINASIPDADARYKNPRNLCSGSVRQLDSRITAQRSVYLYAFALISIDGEPFATRHEQLDYLASLGFDVVERVIVDDTTVVEEVGRFADKIESNDFPSDGLVLIYDDIAYGRSLGNTAKFPRDGIAFKWADELAETVVRCVEWSASRTGLINPVAVFDPVELEGTTVSRASLHNVSIMEELKIAPGDRVTVYKANMIIPQIADNLTRSGLYGRCSSTEVESCSFVDSGEDTEVKNAPADRGGYDMIRIAGTADYYRGSTVPAFCPVCGRPTSIHEENDVRTLYCDNPDCLAKKIKLFAHMASRDAFNIEGLSEATCEKFVDAGIIHRLSDIFHLDEKADAVEALEGMGEKSCNKLLSAIEKAKKTTLYRVIYSLGIPNIGLTGAKLICRYVSDDPERAVSMSFEELRSIDQIGDVLAASYTEFFSDEAHLQLYRDIIDAVELQTTVVDTGSKLAGLIFVVTGSLQHYKSRGELKEFIEAGGGKVTGSVTSKTNYLINNDINSKSSKNKTAKELGVEIITEQEFIERFVNE